MLSNPPTSATQQRGGAPLLDGRGGSGLDGVLSVLRRWRAVLAAAALTGLVCGYLVASAATPSYESRAVMLVGPINGDLDTLRAAGQLAQTYAQIATSRPTVNATGRRLGLSVSPSASNIRDVDQARLGAPIGPPNWAWRRRSMRAACSARRPWAP